VGEEVLLVTGDMGPGEFPDKLGKVLSPHLSEKRVREVVKLYTWVVEIERTDAARGELFTK
jgi:hypothetical protein